MARKWLLVLSFLILPSLARAQSTTVSGQVTDSGGQAWNNGTLTATFVSNPNYPTFPQYVWTGGALSSTYTGTLNGTGGYSISMSSNTAITPVGSMWQFQFCPAATSPCFELASVTVTGATQTLNATPSAISIPAGSSTTAYADSEVVGTAIGQQYYNITSGTIKVCQALPCASNWVSLGAGGTVTSVTATGPIVSTGGSTPVISCPTCSTGGGTIAGTVTTFHIPYASASNTLSDTIGSAVTGATGAITLTAGADTTTQLSLAAHSATQSASQLDINASSAGSATGVPFAVRGKGTGSWTPSGGAILTEFLEDNSGNEPTGWTVRNLNAVGSAGVLSGISAYVDDNGVSSITGGNAVGDSNGLYANISFAANPSLYGATSFNGGLGITVEANGRSNQVPFTIWSATQSVGSSNGDMLDITRGTTPGFPLAGFDTCGTASTAATCKLFFAGTTSGKATISAAAVAGTPCTFLLPAVSPTAGQVLNSAAPSSGACQTSWGTIGSTVCSTCVLTGQTNVYGAFLQDFSAATMEIPEAAGFTANVDSTIGLDTTANAVHLWVNNADSLSVSEAAGITANVIPKSLDATHGLITASLATDNGSTFSYSGANGISTTSDGVHAGQISLVGNTTNPAVPANTAGIVGPALASFTAYSLQLPSTGPTNALPLLSCATPASSVSACTFVANSGLAPAFNTITSGTNTTAAMVVGTGASFKSTPELDIGAVGTSGVLGLVGTTSGKATITAPAVAGTSTNAIVLSNTLNVADGTVTRTAYGHVVNLGDGIWFRGSGAFDIAVNGATVIETGGSAVIRLLSTGVWAFASGAPDATSADTGLSRDSAGVIDVGNGTAADVTGTIKSGKYATGTNCSSSASPAVCGSAAAGSVVVAAAGTTVVVNTTAVTANSQIFLQYDSSLGTKLSVTCNATEPALYGVTARTGGTSFTITATSPVTNPACFSFFIVN
jgi:hypothetical protein